MISRVWEATTAKRMQIDPYCQRQKCSPVNVVSSDIKVMQIFAGVWEIWGLKQGRGSKISHFLVIIYVIREFTNSRMQKFNSVDSRTV